MYVKNFIYSFIHSFIHIRVKQVVRPQLNTMRWRNAKLKL